MKKKMMAIGFLMVVLPSLVGTTVVEQTLALARKQVAQAESFLLAYYDNVILPRKTPTQTAEARSLKLQAAAQAEAALRRFDALRGEMVSLSSPDLVLAGRARLITLDPDRPSLQTEAQQKSILEASQREFSQAWKTDTRNPAAYAGLIEVHRLRLDKKAGEAVIGQAPEEVKQTQVFNLAATRFFLELEDLKQGLNYAKKLGPGKSGEAEPELYQALAYYLNGDAAKARELAQAALGKRKECEAASLFLEHLDGMANLSRGGSPGPRGSRNLLDVGVAFEQRSDHGLSIFIYEKAVKAMPNDSRALYYLGEALAFRAKLMGRKEEAVKAAGYLEKAMKLGGMPDVERSAALVPLAMAYQAAGQYDKAAQVYREIIAADPNFYRYYFDLGDCLKAQGKTKEAEEAYARGKALAPKQTYTSGARWAAVEQKIGPVGDCSAAAELPPGDAIITGQVLIQGKPLAHAQVQLLLDQCAKTTTIAETNDKGEVRVTLPPGRYIYSGLRVSHFPGPQETMISQMVYVPGNLEKLYFVLVSEGPEALPLAKKPGEFTANPGENPALSFVALFVPPLTILAPAENARISVTQAGATEVKWEKVASAHHYLVDFYQVSPSGNAVSLTLIKQQLSVNDTKITVADLFAAGGKPVAAGTYGVMVSAVDASGQVIARAENLRRFTLE